MGQFASRGEDDVAVIKVKSLSSNRHGRITTQ